MKSLSALMVAAVAGTALSASAGVIFGTGFEAPTYAPGQLNGQAGWIVGALPGGSITAGNMANVVNNAANAFAGSQYVETNTTNYSADTTSSTYRLAYGYQGHTGITAADIATNPIVHTSAAIRMNLTASRRGGFATINNYTASFANMGAIGIAWTGAGIAASGPFATPNTSYLYVATAAGAFVFSGATPTDFINGWFKFDMSLDYGTGLISFSVNGSSLDSQLDGFGFDRSFDNTSPLDQADMQAERDRPVSGASTGGAVIRFDDYLIEMNAVPVPGSAVLLGVGGMLASRRRRR